MSVTNRYFEGVCKCYCLINELCKHASNILVNSHIKLTIEAKNSIADAEIMVGKIEDIITSKSNDLYRMLECLIYVDNLLTIFRTTISKISSPDLMEIYKDKMAKNVYEYFTKTITNIPSTEKAFVKLMKEYAEGIIFKHTQDNKPIDMDHIIEIYERSGEIGGFIIFEIVLTQKRSSTNMSSQSEIIKNNFMGIKPVKLHKSNYPVMDMIMTFGLCPIVKNDTYVDPSPNDIIINNTTCNSNLCVRYDIRRLMYGKYSEFSRKSGISVESIEMSNSIRTYPKDVFPKQVSGFKCPKKIADDTRILETLDGGKTYTEMKNNAMVGIDIMNGPKQRLDKYNKYMSDILFGNPNNFIKKLEKEQDEEIQYNLPLNGSWKGNKTNKIKEDSDEVDVETIDDEDDDEILLFKRVHEDLFNGKYSHKESILSSLVGAQRVAIQYRRKKYSPNPDNMYIIPSFSVVSFVESKY